MKEPNIFKCWFIIFFMNKLLVFLGVIAILASGVFILNYFEISIPYVSELPIEILNTSLFFGIVIAAMGFIRFNKFIGIACFIVGGLSVLSGFSIIPWTIIPVFILPWLLAALGVRFLLIGMLSGENDA